MSLIEAVQEGDGDEPVVRVGSWVLLRDEAHGGLRHCWKASGIMGLSDLDEARTDTVVTVTGGKSIIVPRPLEAVAEALAIP